MDYEEIIKAVEEKMYKAQGEQHKKYESLAVGSHSSFDYGIRFTLYILSQKLGEDKVQKAMQDWLREG